MQMVSLTQRLTRLQQARALKDQLDGAHEKEALLKECIQPWIDEAFIVIATIEGKLETMQELYMIGQECDLAHKSSEIRVEQVQQVVEQCVADNQFA